MQADLLRRPLIQGVLIQAINVFEKSLLGSDCIVEQSVVLAFAQSQNAVESFGYRGDLKPSPMLAYPRMIRYRNYKRK